MKKILIFLILLAIYPIAVIAECTLEDWTNCQDKNGYIKDVMTKNPSQINELLNKYPDSKKLVEQSLKERYPTIASLDLGNAQNVIYNNGNLQNGANGVVIYLRDMGGKNIKFLEEGCIEIDKQKLCGNGFTISKSHDDAGLLFKGSGEGYIEINGKKYKTSDSMVTIRGFDFEVFGDNFGGLHLNERSHFQFNELTRTISPIGSDMVISSIDTDTIINGFSTKDPFTKLDHPIIFEQSRDIISGEQLYLNSGEIVLRKNGDSNPGLVIPKDIMTSFKYGQYQYKSLTTEDLNLYFNNIFSGSNDELFLSFNGIKNVGTNLDNNPDNYLEINDIEGKPLLRLEYGEVYGDISLLGRDFELSTPEFSCGKGGLKTCNKFENNNLAGAASEVAKFSLCMQKDGDRTISFTHAGVELPQGERAETGEFVKITTSDGRIINIPQYKLNFVIDGKTYTFKVIYIPKIDQNGKIISYQEVLVEDVKKDGLIDPTALANALKGLEEYQEKRLIDSNEVYRSALNKKSKELNNDLELKSADGTTFQQKKGSVVSERSFTYPYTETKRYRDPVYNVEFDITVITGSRGALPKFLYKDQTFDYDSQSGYKGVIPDEVKERMNRGNDDLMQITQQLKSLKVTASNSRLINKIYDLMPKKPDGVIVSRKIVNEADEILKNIHPSGTSTEKSTEKPTIKPLAITDVKIDFMANTGLLHRKYVELPNEVELGNGVTMVRIEGNDKDYIVDNSLDGKFLTLTNTRVGGGEFISRRAEGLQKFYIPLSYNDPNFNKLVVEQDNQIIVHDGVEVRMYYVPPNVEENKYSDYIKDHGTEARVIFNPENMKYICGKSCPQNSKFIEMNNERLVRTIAKIGS